MRLWAEVRRGTILIEAASEIGARRLPDASEASSSDKSRALITHNARTGSWSFPLQMLAARLSFLRHLPFRVYSVYQTRTALKTLISTPRTMANLAADRFYADRSAPLCSLDVAKSFAQLT